MGATADGVTRSDAPFELVIRNGTLYDGSGRDAFVGDIGISGGKIAAIGHDIARGREEIDATGKMVTPGFIDVHTHYDGQLIWSERLSPSSAHGVTTVVTGNCGVGFAPCRPHHHQALIQLLEGVEDMPEIVLAAGLTWEWETFPEFVDAAQRRPHDIDYLIQLPHAALRLYVMGDRAVDGAVATDADLDAMRNIAREAASAGAIGVGTSRNIYHTAVDGTIISTVHAHQAELKAIMEGMAEAGGGALQAILNTRHTRGDLDMLCRVASETGSPLSFTLVQNAEGKDDWTDLLRLTADANSRGQQVTAQVFPRPIGTLLGLDASFNPFSAHPSYARIAHLPLAQRVTEMRKPHVRAAILSEKPDPQGLVIYSILQKYDKMYPVGAVPNYEPDTADSLGARARARGMSPAELAYDFLLEDDGHALLLLTAANFEQGNLDHIHTMLMHPDVVPGLGDGGAHYGMICDSTFTTHMLTHWGRDRAGPRIDLARIVHLLTSKPAATLGLNDRGRLALGLKADINIIDHDRLRLYRPRMVEDLPAGGRRLTQDADGYVATIVAGQIIMREGEPTGALPGKLVRNPGSGAIPLSA